MNILDNFANIGKAVLLQSIGLQKNYSEELEKTIEVIDYNNPSCTNCKYKAIMNSFSSDSEIYKTCVNSCNNCSNKIFTTKTVYKKVYHNEKNKYSYRPTLKSNAIKLLLLFHFYHPDRFGIINDINTDELANHLHCDVKTVHNNLNILSAYGYISYCKTAPHYINLCLTDYEKYYLPANQGGRGFFVLSKELLFELLSLDNLLSLRIHLRELIDIDNLNTKGPFTAISKTYKELKRSLPDYCKPCNIRYAVKNSSDIFDISFKENAIRFEIKDCFNSRKQKQECYNHYLTMFKDFLTTFNETVVIMNTCNYIPDTYSEFFDGFINPNNHYRLISIKDFEFEDLAQLALQYSFDSVITAFSDIYKSYILNDKKVINLGGLLRTVIISNLKSITNQAA